MRRSSRSRSEPTPDSGKTTVIGWGKMQDGTFPTTLMVADLDLEPSATCNSGIKSIYARDLKAALSDLSRRMRYSEKGIDAAANAIAADMSDPLTNNMICAGTDQRRTRCLQRRQRRAAVHDRRQRSGPGRRRQLG